jgi:hypothetical protein
MSVQTTDSFLVQRGTTQYHVTAANANSTIADADILLVQRGAIQYKITGAVFKSAAFQDGDLYIVNRAGVDYKATGALVKAILRKAPIIKTLVLAEDDAAHAAFTSQAFTATITMQEPGMPVATHNLKAWVEGNLTTRLTSTNAITAKTRLAATAFANQGSHGLTGNFGGIAYLNGRWYGGGDRLLYSDDGGATWKPVTYSGAPGGGWVARTNGLAYGSGIYAVFHTNENWFSADGLTFSKSEPVAGERALVASMDGTLVAMSYDGASSVTTTLKILKSTGSLGGWTTAGTIYSPAQLQVSSLGIASDGNGSWLAVGRSSTGDLYVFRSTNQGATWTTVCNGATKGPGGFLLFNHGKWLNVGNAPYAAVSSDGITWTSATNAWTTGGASNTLGWVSGGLFYAYDQNRLGYSVDGITWTYETPPAVFNAINGNAEGDVVAMEPTATSPNAWTKQGPRLELSIAGALSDGFKRDDLITSLPAAAGPDGISSITDAKVVVATPLDLWAVGQHLQGQPKTQPGARLYLKFNAAGAVSDLSSADPGWVQTTNQNTPKLTFPATLPSGKKPDEELPAGTTITVEAQATNAAGTVTKVSNIVTPARELKS